MIPILLAASIAYFGSPADKPEYAPSARRMSGIASLAVSPVNGRMWCSWYCGVTTGEDTNNYVVLSTSIDKGKTWKEVLVADPDGKGPRRTFDPGLWVNPDGTLWWTWTDRDHRLYEEHKDDEHVSDSDVLYLAELSAEDEPTGREAPREIARGVMMCKPTVLKDGSWALPVAAWNKDGSSRMIVTTDHGKTFALRGAGTLPKDERLYDEHMFVEKANGDIDCYSRTKNGLRIGTSTDGGRTWGAFEPAGFTHPSARLFVRRLKSGNLLLVKHNALDSASRERTDLTAFISRDDGKTWEGGLLLDPRVWISYPDGQEMDDGTIYVCYDYARYNSDQHMLFATFTEADALAGNNVSGKVTRQNRISALRFNETSGYRELDEDGRFKAAVFRDISFSQGTTNGVLTLRVPAGKGYATYVGLKDDGSPDSASVTVAKPELIEAAVRWAKDHIHEYGGDSRKITDAAFGGFGTPTLKGTTIRCFNKEISVNPKEGLIRISADGEELALFRHIYPVRNLKTGKCHWPGMHKPAYTNDNGRMIFDDDVTLGGLSWHQYHQEVELMSNGLLRVSTQALYCPYTNLYQTIAGENGAFTLQWKVARGTAWTKTNDTLTVFSDDPALSFSIIGRKADGVTRLAVVDYPHARMVEVKGVNKTFYIDIRKGVKRAATSDTMGGVDFLRVENMHMPDFSCGNYVYNPSFEMGFKGWYSRFKGRVFDPSRYEKPWFALDRDEKLFGGQSVKMFAYHNQKNVKELRELDHGRSLSTMPVSLDPGTYRFSCWAKANRKNCWIKAWYAGFRFSTCWLPVAKDADLVREVAVGEWTRYETTFTLDNADMLTAHITVCCGDGEGFVWLDGVTLEKVKSKSEEGKSAEGDFLQPAVQAHLLTTEKDNLIEEGDAIDARLRLSARPMGAGTVRVSVSNWQGKKVSSFEKSFACDEHGEAIVPLDLKLGRGLYVLRYDFTLGESRSFQYDRLTVVKSPGNTARWSRLFGHVYANDPAKSDFRDRLLRCKRLGINNVYHVVSGAAEHAEYDKLGIYNANSQMVCEDDTKDGWGLQGADGTWLIRNAKKEGVPLDDAYLKRFKAAVAQRAREFPHILEWEFSNEFFARAGRALLPHAETDEAYDDWAKYMKAYVEGVHEGNPNAVAYSDAPYNMSDGGCEEMTHILRACAKIGCRFDGIGFHIYRFSPENPDLDGHYERMKKVLKELGYPDTTPFHHGEGMHWGPYEIPAWTLQCSMWAHTPSTWTTHSTLTYDIGKSERRSAAWRMRTWLVGLKNAPRCRQMNSSNTNNHGLDLYQTPRLSQLVSATLSNHLGDADFIEDIRFAPFIRAFVFTDGEKRPVVAVWCHKEEVDFCREKAPTAKAALGDALVEVRDMADMDVTTDHKPDAKGVVVFAVESAPKLFIGRPGSLDTFLAAFRQAQIVGGDLGSRYKVSVNPASPTTARLRLEDFLTRGVSNAIVTTSAPLSYERPVRVDLPKEKLGYTALLAKKVADTATLETLDWESLPALAFPNRIAAHDEDRGKKLRHFRKEFDATYRLGWNKKGLFVEIDVKDATFSHVAFKPEGNRWDNDCAQVYFDTFANARENQTKGYDSDDYDYLISPEPDGSRARVWRARVADMQLVKGTESPLPRRYATDDHPIPVSFEKTADGYRYRVFFPAEAVLPLKLEKGSVVGLGVCVSDANDDTKTKWLSRREGCLTNAIEKNDCYNKPHLYPAVLLWE